MEVLGNARIERVVDRITSDTDIGATDACIALGNQKSMCTGSQHL